MTITTETKIIARLHTTDNGTGLNIYNPYFQDQGLDVVYLLFQNPKPEPLVQGIKNLKLAGAITAGFEHDSDLPNLVDEKTEAVVMAQRVGIIINNDGKLKAHYQGGEGLLSAIKEKSEIENKKIVLIGAGTVAATFLLALQRSSHSTKVAIYNRTLEKAKQLKQQFECVVSVDTLENLDKVEGNILINASRIGSKVEDVYFTNQIVSRFEVAADVTFRSESTNLTNLAGIENITVVSGWDMFTHQAGVVLREILGHEPNLERLRHFVRQGLASNNHGVVTK